MYTKLVYNFLVFYVCTFFVYITRKGTLHLVGVLIVALSVVNK